MFHDLLADRRSPTSTRLRRRVTLLAVAAIGTTAVAAPAAAHGVDGRTAGVAFPAVVAGAVAASLLGGGLVLAVTGRNPRWRGVVPVLLLALGGLSVSLAVRSAPTGAGLGVVGGAVVVALARGHAHTDCADAAVGAVTLHRGFEGVVLAAVYAADAALGILGAVVLATHGAAETAAVGSLYAPVRRHAVAAVCLLQAGFVAGVAAGWRVFGAVPAGVEAGLLALVGAALLAAGAHEGYHRYAGRRPAPAA